MSQPIRDGETIASAGGSFELGFFSPGHSANRYLGIWYKKVSLMTAVWVANRNTPLINLVLLNQYGTIIWSSYTTSLMLNPVAQLLESGNFVVRDAEDVNLEKFIWQSFDYPGDTLLPGMKQGRNTITGLDRYLSSWKSFDDPSSGDFTYKLDPRGFPELVLRKGSVEQFRAGPWNGLWFSGSPGLKPNPIYKFDFVFNEKEMYYYYMLLNSSVVTRAVLNENGIFQRLLWIDRTKGWNVYLTAQTDNCDSYALCGAYGCCNIANSPACGCLKGFVPKSPKDWAIGDWSDGCVRKLPLDCQNRDGFIKYSDVKLPDTRYSWFNRYMTLEECNMACLWNCSCMAYSNLDIRVGGSGCLLWFGNLIDIREFTENGQEIYIRMSSSEVGQTSSIGEKQVKIVVTLTVLVGMLVLTLGVILYIRKKKKLGRQEKNEHNPGVHTAECQKGGQELTPLFDWATVANATNYFSVNNKLGEGGFGPVYKGKLVDGQEIAVKRLSHNSTQGVDEFKNEVACVAKLQHRNLVKLLGCCIEEEKMLIYEYMPNKSLDFFIFDKKQSMLLNWQKRFNIINGISRGILYLHQDSRLRIIHRDLKASNILLDYEMNPKISDFGLARRIGGNETKANTARVVGTYGYMPPEYAIDGFFSVKSDVFSFGVVVLEIVSGKKNRGFCHPDHRLNLLGHAWRLFGEGRSVELIDASIRDSFHLSELLRSVHVGLLCVQEGPEDRPPMSYVILMLSSEGELPQPKQPGFFHERKLEAGESSSSKQEYCSVNEMTVTLAAR